MKARHSLLAERELLIHLAVRMARHKSKPLHTETADDIAGTRATLESQGEGVLTRDFAHLAGIPEVLAPAAPEPEKRRDGEPATVADSPTRTLASSPPGPLSRAVIKAIHDCLRHLADACDGARSLDGHGFNKLDAKFGRSLAQSPSRSPKQARQPVTGGGACGGAAGLRGGGRGHGWTSGGRAGLPQAAAPVLDPVGGPVQHARRGAPGIPRRAVSFLGAKLNCHSRSYARAVAGATRPARYA